MSEQLNREFTDAVYKMDHLNFKIPIDKMLMFYAYYKQATNGDNFTLDANLGVKDSFKLHAWLQLRGMNAEEAKKEYIKLSKEVLKK